MYKVQSVLKVQLCAASAGLVLHSLWYLQQKYLPAGQSTIHVLSCVHFPNASEGRIQGSEGMGRH